MIKLKNLILENEYAGKTYIVVDVQPEYEKSIGYDINTFMEFLNSNYESFNNLIFLYNGIETVGETSENKYKEWLLDNGLEWSIIDSAKFYDKGYAYFRYCMDEGMDEDSIANFVRFMYQNNITDSREMTRDMWAKYLREYRRTDKKDIYELLKIAGDCVNIPNLMEYLKSKRNIVLTGGGIDQCLKEVEIVLKALKVPYEIDNQYIY